MLGNSLTASMPAAAGFYCIYCARDFKMLAFVFGLCRWFIKLGR
jgi:hypothetical protein